MKHRLLNLVVALSLLLCVATAVLWVRSYFRRDVVGRAAMWREGANWYYRETYLSPADGGVRLHVNGYLVNRPAFAERYSNEVGRAFWRVYPPWPERHRLRFPASLGFDWSSDARVGPARNYVAPEVIHYDATSLRVPYWPAAVATALPPLLWLRRRRRSLRRARGGLCRGCGYDLRATPEKCPECGTVAALLLGA